MRIRQTKQRRGNDTLRQRGVGVQFDSDPPIVVGKIGEVRASHSRCAKGVGRGDTWEARVARALVSVIERGNCRTVRLGIGVYDGALFPYTFHIDKAVFHLGRPVCVHTECTVCGMKRVTVSSGWAAHRQ